MQVFDILSQLVEQIADGRTLYRHCQVQKSKASDKDEKAVWAQRAAETDDDVDTLVRQFRVLTLRVEAEIAAARCSDISLGERVTAAQERIAQRRVA